MTDNLDDYEVHEGAPPGNVIPLKSAREKQNTERSSYQIIKAISWADQPVPERKWVIPGLLPAGDASLLNGHGGTSKTQLALQISVAVVLGADVLGFLVERRGPVLFITAEEGQDEMHRRTNIILDKLGKRFQDVEGLDFICMPEEPEYIATSNRNTGMVKRTAYYEWLERTVIAGQYSLVVMENAAQLFSGSEIDRDIVQRFAAIVRRLGMRSGAAVLLLQHVSLGGLSSGDSYSGSTQWHNAFRSRFSIETPRGEDGRAFDDVRIIRGHKLNYGRKTRDVRLAVEPTGYLRLDMGAAPLEELKAQAEAEEVFLACLDSFTLQGRRVSAKPGTTYAPTMFSKAGIGQKVGRNALAAAMERLLASGRIILVPNSDVKPSKATMVLVRPHPEEHNR